MSCYSIVYEIIIYYIIVLCIILCVYVYIYIYIYIYIGYVWCYRHAGPVKLTLAFLKSHPPGGASPARKGASLRAVIILDRFNT